MQTGAFFRLLAFLVASTFSFTSALDQIIGEHLIPIPIIGVAIGISVRLGKQMLGL